MLLAIYYIISLKYYKYFDGAGKKKIELLKWLESGDPTSFCKIRINLDPIDKLLKGYNEKNP